MLTQQSTSLCEVRSWYCAQARREGEVQAGDSRQAVAPDDSGVLKELMVCKSVDESVGHLSVPHAGGEGGVQEEKKKGPAPVSNVTVVVLAWWAPHPAHTQQPCLLHRVLPEQRVVFP
jgi:hypothetical protein